MNTPSPMTTARWTLPRDFPHINALGYCRASWGGRCPVYAGGHGCWRWAGWPHVCVCACGCGGVR